MMRGESVDGISFDQAFITKWDFAAPFLFLREAGGAWLQNKPLYQASKDPTLRFVAARDERTARLIWERLYPDTEPPYNAVC